MRCAAGRPRSASMSTVVSSSDAGTPDDRSADATFVARALGPDPGRGILVPFVSGIGDRLEGGLDGRPAALVVERVADRLSDEGAAPSAADAAIGLGDEIVREAYVQTHGHSLAHSLVDVLAPQSPAVSRGFSHAPKRTRTSTSHT